MPDVPDPPRKNYQLGKSEFKRANPTPETVGATAPNQDVQSHLRDNLARANAAGLNEITLRPRRASRRTRDYLTLLLLVNSFFVVALAYYGLHTVAGSFALAAIIFYSAALTWVMWGVMDNY